MSFCRGPGDSGRACFSTRWKIFLREIGSCSVGCWLRSSGTGMWNIRSSTSVSVAGSTRKLIWRRICCTYFQSNEKRLVPGVWKQNQVTTLKKYCSRQISNVWDKKVYCGERVLTTVYLVLYSFEHGKPCDIFVQKAPVQGESYELEWEQIYYLHVTMLSLFSHP